MSIEQTIVKLKQAQKQRDRVGNNEIQLVRVDKKIHAYKEILFLEITRLTKHADWKNKADLEEQACRLGCILWKGYDPKPTIFDLDKSG